MICATVSNLMRGENDPYAQAEDYVPKTRQELNKNEVAEAEAAATADLAFAESLKQRSAEQHRKAG